MYSQMPAFSLFPCVIYYLSMNPIVRHTEQRMCKEIHMSRRQAHLVTLIGCMISLVSFCFLPYLVVPFSSFSFTGLQLLMLGDPSPLSNDEWNVGYPLGLQLLLVILLLLGAIREVFLTRRTKRAGHGYAKGIMI